MAGPRGIQKASPRREVRRRAPREPRRWHPRRQVDQQLPRLRQSCHHPPIPPHTRPGRTVRQNPGPNGGRNDRASADPPLRGGASPWNSSRSACVAAAAQVVEATRLFASRHARGKVPLFNSGPRGARNGPASCSSEYTHPQWHARRYLCPAQRCNSPERASGNLISDPNSDSSVRDCKPIKRVARNQMRRVDVPGPPNVQAESVSVAERVIGQNVCRKCVGRQTRRPIAVFCYR